MSTCEMRMAVEAAGEKSILQILLQSGVLVFSIALRYYLKFTLLHFGRLLAQQPPASDNCGPLQWARPHHWLRQLCVQPGSLRVTLQWVLSTSLFTFSLETDIDMFSIIYNRHLQDPGQGWVWWDTVGFHGGKSQDVTMTQNIKPCFMDHAVTNAFVFCPQWMNLAML